MLSPSAVTDALRSPAIHDRQLASVTTDTTVSGSSSGTNEGQFAGSAISGLCANCSRRPLEWQLFPAASYAAIYPSRAPPGVEDPKRRGPVAAGEGQLDQSTKSSSSSSTSLDRPSATEPSPIAAAAPHGAGINVMPSLVMFDECGEEASGDGDCSSDEAGLSDDAPCNDTWNAKLEQGRTDSAARADMFQTLQAGMLQFVALVILSHRGLRPHILMVSRPWQECSDLGETAIARGRRKVPGCRTKLPKAYLPTFQCGRTSRPETAAQAHLSALVGRGGQIGEVLGHLWITEWGARALPLIPAHITRPLRQIVLFQAVVRVESQIRLPDDVEGFWVPLELLLTAEPLHTPPQDEVDCEKPAPWSGHPALEVAAFRLESNIRRIDSLGDIGRSNNGAGASAVTVCPTYGAVASFVSRFSLCTMAAVQASASSIPHLSLVPAAHPAPQAASDGDDEPMLQGNKPLVSTVLHCAPNAPIAVDGTRSFVAPELREEEDLEFDDDDDDDTGRPLPT